MWLRKKSAAEELWEASPLLSAGILGHLRLDPGLQPHHGRCVHFGAVASLCVIRLGNSPVNLCKSGKTMACFVALMAFKDT